MDQTPTSQGIIIQETAPVNKNSTTSDVVAYSEGKIPKKILHLTSLANIVKKQRTNHVCQQIEDNNIQFLATETNPEKLKSRNTKKIVSIHKWKGLKVSVLGFIEVKNVSLQTLDYLVGKDIYKLKSLRIKFNNSSWFGDKELRTVTYHLTRNLPQTLKFGMVISGSHQITAIGLKQAGSIISRNLPSIKILRFDMFLCPKINGTGFLSKISRNLTKLKKVFFNFGGSNQSDDSLALSASTIAKRLNKLEDLKLYYWCAERVTDTGLSDFAVQICRNLKDLQSFYLNLRGCPLLTTAGIAALVNEICENLTNLKKLVLIVEGCEENNITSVDAVVNLAYEKLPNLKQISSTDEDDDMNLYH